MTYDALKVAHILVLAAWLGLEIAVFVLFSRHRNADIPIEGRRALAEVHEPIAFGPRVFWMPMIVLGLALANLGNWGFAGTAGSVLVVAAVVVGTAWLVGMAYLFWVRRNLPATTSHLGRVRIVDASDTWLRLLIVAGLLAAGVVSLATQTPIPSQWLAWKVIVVGVLVAVTLAWKRVGRRIAIERRIAVGNNPDVAPSEERFATFSGLTLQAQALLATFWALILVIVWLAVAKP